MLVQCWASVADGGPSLNQHWVKLARKREFTCSRNVHEKYWAAGKTRGRAFLRRNGHHRKETAPADCYNWRLPPPGLQRCLVLLNEPTVGKCMKPWNVCVGFLFDITFPADMFCSNARWGSGTSQKYTAVSFILSGVNCRRVNQHHNNIRQPV